MSNLHPGLILLLVGVIAAIVPKNIRKYVMAVGPAVALAAVFTLDQGDLWVVPFINGMQLHLMVVDKLSWIFVAIFTLLAFMGGIYAMHNDSWAEALASMSYAGSTVCMVLAGDWVTLLFFWELMAITSLYLIWANHTARSRRAGFRYIMVHFFGGNMLLFGVVLKVTGGDFLVSNLTANHDLAFWLILIAVCINSVVPPLHAWVADAYPESTITGGVFMSSLTTKAGIYVMIRLFAGTDWLIWVGVIMAIYGAIFAIIENDMRRLLSYHIVSQLGFMVAGVGLGTGMALDGATAHAVTNVLQKSMLFMCAGAVMYSTGRRKLNELGGLAKQMPLLCVFFLIAAFSISGVPLFDGFVAKSITISAAAEAGNGAMELLLSLASIGTFLSITLKMTYFMFFAPAQNGLEIKRPIPKNMMVAMGIAAFMNIIFGIVPSLLHNALPYPIEYHAYTVDHLTQYVEVLVASMIPFLVYLAHMMPHSKLALDFDWFYRKPLVSCVSWISSLCCAIRDGLGGMFRGMVDGLKPFMDNPVAFMGRTWNGTIPKQYDADQYRPEIGEVMLVDFLILAVAIAIFWVLM